jgi:hypothetical protein
VLCRARFGLGRLPASLSPAGGLGLGCRHQHIGLGGRDCAGWEDCWEVLLVVLHRDFSANLQGLGTPLPACLSEQGRTPAARMYPNLVKEHRPGLNCYVSLSKLHLPGICTQPNPHGCNEVP